MDWKLARGKFRPKLQALISSNTEEAVQAATKDGLAAIMDDGSSDSQIKEAMRHLTSLKVLHCHRQDVWQFMQPSL